MITKLYNINDPSRFLHMWPVSLNLLGEVGRPQRWDHLLWQHWLCHAHSLPGIAIESPHPAEPSLRVAIPKSPARFASPSHPNPHSMRISCFIIPSQCVTMEGWINILYWVSFFKKPNQNFLQIFSYQLDWRCFGELLQLDLFCPSHRHRLLLHAQSRPWRPQWVSDQHCRQDIVFSLTQKDIPSSENVWLIHWASKPFLILKVESEALSIFSEFSNERTRVERRENFRKLRMKENFFRAIDGYFDWISDAGTE